MDSVLFLTFEKLYGFISNFDENGIISIPNSKYKRLFYTDVKVQNILSDY